MHIDIHLEHTTSQCRHIGKPHMRSTVAFSQLQPSLAAVRSVVTRARAVSSAARCLVAVRAFLSSPGLIRHVNAWRNEPSRESSLAAISAVHRAAALGALAERRCAASHGHEDADEARRSPPAALGEMAMAICCCEWSRDLSSSGPPSQEDAGPPTHRPRLLSSPRGIAFSRPPSPFIAPCPQVREHARATRV
ncbi:hypothetical protein NUW54_g1923 [Trametes sanguinea]|uniref:Uncharacterized protein n=1 Tax=Trametes sanguinea TaxID=158606 RepID=A0ACC1Q7W6_9APHY|nr:hypothetical protein NUW54_g1923 [Trametes sanguinea]